MTDELDRRGALRVIGGAGLLVALAACGSDSESSATSSTRRAAASAGCDEISDETGGPFPADGSNGPNVLSQSGVVRDDIRSSFGSASGVAEGVPLTIELTVQQTAKNCAAYSGAAVYLWHCDREGRYSMYSQGVTTENYLRGVQAADVNGELTFKSIFPAAYSGRWPHIHFEVFPSVGSLTTKLKTSQLALPEDVCRAAYATTGYEQSVRNLAQSSLSTDNVFQDGYDDQLATVTGSPASGYTAKLTVAV